MIERCEWCGHEHARDALCTSRPKWSRRGFLAMFGAGIAGLAVAPSLPAAEAAEIFNTIDLFAAGRRGGKTVMGIDAILKSYYEPMIARQLEEQRALFSLLKPKRMQKGETFRVDAR